ncbi:hypothetical protein LXA43DRAFT_1187693 [Ganoderma leucocontextum]|nr:hypothetical protein LXA43DRAFT_1187693 [Ganoderma leucocontextum]
MAHSRRTRARSKREPSPSPDGDQSGPLGDIDAPPSNEVGRDAPVSPQSQPSKPYSLRRTTQGCHPGINAGLARRRQQDIADEAERKREAQRAKTEAAVRARKEKDKRDVDGAKRVAALQDKRAREDAENVAKLHDPPPSEDEDKHERAPARPTGTHNNARSSAGIALLEDELESVGAGDDHVLPSHDGSDGEGSEGSVKLTQPPSDDVFDQPEEWPELGRDVGQVASGSEFELDPDHDEDEDEDEEEEEEEEQEGAKAKSSKRPAAKESGEKTKPLSKAQKVKLAVTKARDAVHTHRNVSVPAKRAAPTSARKSTQPVKKPKKVNDDAFTPDFRKAMRDNSRRANSPSPADDAAAKVTFEFESDGDRTPTRATRRRPKDSTSRDGQDDDDTQYAGDTFDQFQDDIEYLSRPAPSKAKKTTKSRAPLSDEEIHGLNDQDLDVPRPQPRASGKGKTPQRKSLVSVAANTEVFGDGVVTPTTKKKRTRTKVSSEESRGYDALPTWVKDKILDTIVPSMIKFYGTQENPWDLDQVTGSHFLELLRSVLKAACPDHNITLDKGDKIYKFARQRVYDWRKGFQTLAIKLVEREVSERNLATRAAVRRFASEARAAGGEALYDTPNVQSPKDARGAMQSTYIVKLLAYHLNAIEGGRLKTSPHPGGALALAGVAIRRAFGMFTNGEFLAEAQDFGQRTVGLKTKTMYEGSVQPLIKRPARMEALMDAAWEHAPYMREETGEDGGNSGYGVDSDVEAYMVVDPINIVARASQLTAELLVVVITWWYSYQSYRIRKGINLGKTVSSLLIYNGSLYFLFLATLYIIDVIFHTASVPDTVLNADSFLLLFFDPIASILTCHFMLSLRQFDNQEHTASTVLQFGARPSDSLPAFIASFAYPVHVDSALSQTDPDAIVDDGSEWREMDVVAPARTTPSYQSTSPAPNQASNLNLERAM